MPCEEARRPGLAQGQGSESDAFLAMLYSRTPATDCSAQRARVVQRVKVAGLAVTALLGCVALGCAVTRKVASREQLRRGKSLVGLSGRAVDCSDMMTREANLENMRILTDGGEPVHDPCKTPTEMGKAASELRAEMEALKEQQDKLTQAAYVANFQAKIERGECSAGLSNCNATKCCNSPGAQCFAQTPGVYAQCRQTCKQGKDPTHWDSGSWQCEALGDRTPGENICSDMHENCVSSQCCNGVGMQCFQKNSTFGSCKAECAGGAPDMSDKDGKPWACKELGPRSLSTAGWVGGECAPHAENCGTKQCCSEAGMQCYSQTDQGQEVFWGLCKEACNPGKDPRKPWEESWNCREIGSRTPTAPQKGSKVENWALEPGACSDNEGNCKDTKCCLGVDVQCYEKNKFHAQCKRWCNPGELDANPTNASDTWSCTPLSTRSWGLATKGWPSLFCFSLARTKGYEMEILRHQYAEQIGVFECDSAAVLAADGVVELAPGFSTLKVAMAEITTSQDGTAGNSKLFVNVWRRIVEDGRFRNYAWTIKVDPDAVIMPSRMRDHMATHTGENVFVVNCNKFTNSPNFPMMYGAVEIFSNKAMEAYAEKQEQCLTDMGMMMAKWGEDFYMTRCMDHIGVGRVGDWFSLGDQLCMGADCGDPRSASYHPFKSLDSWSQCHDAAVASEAR